MGEQRRNPAFAADWQKAIETEDLAKAVAILTKWLGQPTVEEYEPVRYDPDTGKPVAYRWESLSGWNWEGVVWVDYEWNDPDPWVSSTSPLGRALNRARNSSVLVHSEGGSVVIRYVRQRDEGGSGEGGGTVPKHFIIERVSVVDVTQIDDKP